jgi:hypothetical protein
MDPLGVLAGVVRVFDVAMTWTLALISYANDAHNASAAPKHCTDEAFAHIIILRRFRNDTGADNRSSE